MGRLFFILYRTHIPILILNLNQRNAIKNLLPPGSELICIEQYFKIIDSLILVNSRFFLILSTFVYFILVDSFKLKHFGFREPFKRVFNFQTSVNSIIKPFLIDHQNLRFRESISFSSTPNIILIRQKN